MEPGYNSLIKIFLGAQFYGYLHYIFKHPLVIA